MSTIGLYSTLYSRLSECAELLDQTLIHLKQKQQTNVSEQQQKLGYLLSSLTQSPKEIEAQLLIILLQDTPKKNLAEWSRLGQKLLSNQVTSTELRKLEDLARILEYERADTSTRMRGGNAS
ncbi:MAG: hypothetical protein NW224_20965 [Leptolyngbyaceae cyanobacterium bins.302]|nr:hypothetical protein [Leptolyngbyaceae cyanobacterium bins.302]